MPIPETVTGLLVPTCFVLNVAVVWAMSTASPPILSLPRVTAAAVVPSYTLFDAVAVTVSVAFVIAAAVTAVVFWRL